MCPESGRGNVEKKRLGLHITSRELNLGPIYFLLFCLLLTADFLTIVLNKNTVLSQVVSAAMTEYHRLDDL